MNAILNINCLLIAISLFHRGFVDQSGDEGSPDQIRMFSNLNDLRTSEIPFKPGSRVILDDQTIRTLRKNSFICETCEFITTLNLTGCKIKEIEKGAFENLRYLKNLDMSANEVLQISPQTFAGIINLEILNLKTNNLTDLKNKTFAKNYRLNKLDLSSNNIKYIEDLAFYNLSSLDWLMLSNNDIVVINFEIFRTSSKLKGLYLASNKLVKIKPPNADFPNIIESIDVSNNQLTEGVDNIYLPNVKKIILNQNKIMTLNVQALKRNCPKLEYIELFRNNWACRELPALESSLQTAKIEYGKPIKCIKKRPSTININYVLIYLTLLSAGGISICGVIVMLVMDRKEKRRKRQRERLNEAIQLEEL